MHTIIGSIVRITIAAICATLLLHPVGSSARVLPLDQLTRSAVDTEALKYRRAVNDLGSIESMSLKTEADFKKAGAIVNDQVENLRFVKYRMVQIALSNSLFTNALESEFLKSKGGHDGETFKARWQPRPRHRKVLERRAEGARELYLVRQRSGDRYDARSPPHLR